MTELQQTEVLAWWEKHRKEIIAERAEQIYLKHYAENREQGKGLSESQVAVNAMMDFYEQMKNKPTNGYGKESEDYKNSI